MKASRHVVEAPARDAHRVAERQHHVVVVRRRRLGPAPHGEVVGHQRARPTRISSVETAPSRRARRGPSKVPLKPDGPREHRLPAQFRAQGSPVTSMISSSTPSQPSAALHPRPDHRCMLRRAPERALEALQVRSTARPTARRDTGSCRAERPPGGRVAPATRSRRLRCRRGASRHRLPSAWSICFAARRASEMISRATTTFFTESYRRSACR